MLGCFAVAAQRPGSWFQHRILSWPWVGSGLGVGLTGGPCGAPRGVPSETAGANSGAGRWGQERGWNWGRSFQNEGPGGEHGWDGDKNQS